MNECGSFIHSLIKHLLGPPACQLCWVTLAMHWRLQRCIGDSDLCWLLGGSCQVRAMVSVC